MKKTIKMISISLILLSIAYIPTQAQELHSQFGIKGGLNLSNLYVNDATSSDMQPGFNVGLFSKLPASDFIAIQPELYLTTKGASVTYDNAFATGTANFNLTYLEVPILLVLNLTDNVNIQVGPYVSYLLSGNVKNKTTNGNFNFEDNLDANDYNRIDAGIAVGAGIDLGAISLGARYNYGMTKVGKEQSFLGTTYNSFPDATNGVLNFYVALSLK